MKKIYHLIFPTVCICILTACNEEKLKPLERDETAPDPVVNVAVENLPGGAKISYKLPPASNVLYVEAEWESNGKTMTSKSSYFDNAVRIEGFGDTLLHDISLYAVSRSLVRSAPVSATIKPKTPPIWTVFESMEMVEDFGGFRVDFTNLHEAEVALEVTALDSLGEWVPVEVFYTKTLQGRFFVRGFDPVETDFGVTVKDKWGNRTTRRSEKLIPLFEEMLDKDLFRPHVTPGDAKAYAGSNLANLWSGITNGVGVTSPALFRTANGSGIPHHFTFDMGVTAKLGRYMLWQRGIFNPPHNDCYVGGDVRRWEVWGSNSPDPLGSYNGWIKLMDCEMIKPSGLPPGQLSNEDIEVGQAGHEFMFPPDLPPVRYIRFNIVNTWGGTDYMFISELSFFGQPQ